MDQNQKDRIKELIAIVLLVLTCVIEIALIVLYCYSTYNNIGLKREVQLLLVSIMLFPCIMLTIIFYLISSIKTLRKKTEYYSFQTNLNCPLKEQLQAIYGQIKQSKYRDCDYYAEQTFFGDVFSKDLIVVGHIGVDENYTEQDYKRFVEQISTIQDNEKNYHTKQLIIIFSSRQENSFVKDFFNSNGGGIRSFLFCVLYNEEEKQIVIKKNVYYEDKLLKKQLKKIFSIKGKPNKVSIQISNKQ